MSKYKVLIAEDEEPARARLKQLLAGDPDFEVTCEVTDGDQLLLRLSAGTVDVAFLDIRMPGLPVFQALAALKAPPLIVFQTAYPEHAVDAFTVEAADYLLKPCSRERFASCLRRLKEKLAAREKPPPSFTPPPSQFPRQISLKDGNALKVLPVDEIIKISFEKGFSFVYTAGGRFLSDKSLTSFVELLDPDSFYRINRNQIVNLRCIRRIHPMFKNSYCIELTEGEKLTVSRRRAGELKKRLPFL